MRILILVLIVLTGCTQPEIAQTLPEIAESEIVEQESVKVYPVYDIPMTEDLQQYTFDLCQEYNLSYELVLGVIHTESRFIETADSGSSRGIMQISRGTGDWVSEEVGIRDFDPYDPKQNITVGIYYLAYLRDYWTEQGYSDEDAFPRMLISYNRGVQGCKKYIEKYGIDNSYVDKVYELKIELEQIE